MTESAENKTSSPQLPRSLSATELRVLGTLIEKSLTTPEQYPLSLNAAKVGCNQKTSRDPVVNFDERTVGMALRDLIEMKLVSEVFPADRGAVKYQHQLGRALDLRQPAFVVLGVLMLRGVQTPGELRQNTHRMQAFDDLSHLEEVLDRLSARGLVVKHHRQAGQREDRFAQLLGGADAATKLLAASPMRADSSVDANRADDLQALRDEINSLRARVDALEAMSQVARSAVDQNAAMSQAARSAVDPRNAE